MAGAVFGPGSASDFEQERVRRTSETTSDATEYWSRSGPVRGPLTRQEVDAMAASAQATIADPIPLGLAGFASARFTISTVYVGWFRFSPADLAIVIPVALIFGGVASFLAGMWAFRRGNTLAATTFATFGAFNASWAILQWMMLVGLVPAVAKGGNPAAIEGILVLTFSLISLYLGVAAVGQNVGLAAVLFAMALANGFLGAWALTPATSWVRIVGGYCGIAGALLAFFVSAALVINSAHGRELIPISRPGRHMSSPPLV
jgi:succinate-acetate transporter protein